ncbi:MAG: LacI family DNA-binding transcriptional regulator [Planctomycetota bacterium]|jgi:LacI family transcriptional regulator
MAMARVTLNDVAAEAGVHRTTVSQVLNDRPGCWASDETRARVHAAVEKLGYRPNLAARALRVGKARVVGLLSPGFLAGPHSRPVGLTDAATAHDYTVTVTSDANDAASEDRAIRRLLDRGLDGLVVYPVDQGPHRELRRLVESDFPVVTFEGGNLLDFPSDDISIDYAAVGRLQVEHLLEQGCRQICLANAEPSARVNLLREEAIVDALAEAGMPAPVSLRVPGAGFGEEAGVIDEEDAVRCFLQEHRGGFDGLISHDRLASVVMRVLPELGLRVPDDVAVVGSGNTLLARCGAVPLTSVCTNDAAAGQRAFELLLERISGQAQEQRQRIISPTELIVRGSTLGNRGGRDSV